MGLIDIHGVEDRWSGEGPAERCWTTIVCFALVGSESPAARGAAKAARRQAAELESGEEAELESGGRCEEEAGRFSNPNTKKDKPKSSPKLTPGRPELVFPDQVAGQRRDEEKMGGWIRHVFVRGKGKQAGENYFEYSSPDGWRYRARHAAEKNGYSGDM